MSGDSKIKTIGWIGLGDQGAPMAQAIAEGGFDLHVWARRPESLEALGDVPHIAHASVAELGQAVGALALCLREDSDIEQVISSNSLWQHLKPGAVLINHGTGLPQFAAALSAQGAEWGISVLDAPVSGGRPGAVARKLTTIVGGDKAALDRMHPVFESFSKKIAFMGEAGAGQTGKLINNALLMLNQRSVQQVLRFTEDLNLDVAALVDLLMSGTGSSFALEALRGAVTPQNAEHLKVLQIIDMDLFKDAMIAFGLDPEEIYAAAVTGANGLPEAARRVSPI